MNYTFEHIKKGVAVEFIQLNALISVIGFQNGLKYPVLKLKTEGISKDEIDLKFENAKKKFKNIMKKDDTIQEIKFEISEPFVDDQTFVQFKKYLVKFKVTIDGIVKERIEPLARLKMSVNGKEKVIETCKKDWINRSEEAISKGYISEPVFYTTGNIWKSEEDDFNINECKFEKQFKSDMQSDWNSIQKLYNDYNEAHKIITTIYG